MVTARRPLSCTKEHNSNHENHDRRPSPKLKPLASLLALSPVPLVLGTKDPGRPKYRDTQPPEVQEAFQFLLATAMHEAGKFELLNVAEVEG